MNPSEYQSLDGTALQRLLAQGVVTTSELVELAIDQARRVNPSVNAIVHEQYDRARQDAINAPGVPFLVKDYKCREAGEAYHMGNRLLRSLDYRARGDSLLATRFRGAGLIPIGRTNVSEMALTGTTEPASHGPTHNPWKLTCSPGGSSGGSAAAVAAGIVPWAHGNDISGSIRIPAAHCGLVGLKPTRGRILPSTGTDRAVGMSVEGVVTRTVRDSATLVEAISHVSPWWPVTSRRSLVESLTEPTPCVRIGVCTTAFNGATVDRTNASAAVAIADLLASMGHHVVEDSPSILSSEALWDDAKIALDVTAAAEAKSWEGRIGRPWRADDVESTTWATLERGSIVTGVELALLIERLQSYTAETTRWWERFDVLLTPTTAAPATTLGDYARGYESGRGSAFTRPFNVTGQPAISVPAGCADDGLPRGVQLVAAWGRDDLLLQLAGTIEQARPWPLTAPSLP